VGSKGCGALRYSRCQPEIGGAPVNSFAHVPRKVDVPLEGDARLADARRFVSDVESARGPVTISGPDSTGTAYAVVDSVGRFVDIGLLPGWWCALGPDGVAAGLLEALESARMKAALVPLILRRSGPPRIPPDLGGDDRGEGGLGAETTPPALLRTTAPPDPLDASDVLDTARGRIAEAYRLIDEAGKTLHEQQAVRVIAGPRGLFRLHVRGGRIDHAEAGPQRPTADDTDRLVADARDVLAELARGRSGPLDAWRALE
jgi:hypothetical protein